MRLGLVNFEQTMVWVSGMLAAHEDCRSLGVDFELMEEELDWELSWSNLLVATSHGEAQEIIAREPFTEADMKALDLASGGTLQPASKVACMISVSKTKGDAPGINDLGNSGRGVKGVLAGLFDHPGANDTRAGVVKIYSKIRTSPSEEIRDVETQVAETSALPHTDTSEGIHRRGAAGNRKLGRRLRRIWKAVRKFCCCCISDDDR